MYKNLKNGLTPVNTARNKSGNPPEQLRPENNHFLYSLEQRHKMSLYIYIFFFFSSPSQVTFMLHGMFFDYNIMYV